MASSPPDLKDAQKQYECPICLENVRWRLPVAFKCGHVFCKKCIEMTIEKFGQKCPVCEHEINEAPLTLSLFKIRPRERVRLVRSCTLKSKPVYKYPTKGRPRNGIVKPTKDSNNCDHYECPICAENVIQGNAMSTECGHVFCEKCLETTATECFICRKQITRDKFIRLYI
ncbi:E3 ubiquitin-protein ligase RNF138-like [Drosophila kikkawai]|uniref:E3 ubiquitin-protein ligase RNF138-like n=1 Tax=Drosophila kikkawai TaxID=30033 RepID=A0A6P4JHW3_DROKI|nr:E3 ubiquitin-protein ligase RNF138-like [Drosophila kikkawai]